MTRALRLTCACAVVMLLASAAYCADVYPTVDFAFNSATYEYSWTVNYTSSVNVNFTTLLSVLQPSGGLLDERQRGVVGFPTGG